jgi:hypothetical protein
MVARVIVDSRSTSDSDKDKGCVGESCIVASHDLMFQIPRRLLIMSNGCIHNLGRTLIIGRVQQSKAIQMGMKAPVVALFIQIVIPSVGPPFFQASILFNTKNILQSPVDNAMELCNYYGSIRYFKNVWFTRTGGRKEFDNIGPQVRVFRSFQWNSVYYYIRITFNNT